MPPAPALLRLLCSLGFFARLVAFDHPFRPFRHALIGAATGVRRIVGCSVGKDEQACGTAIAAVSLLRRTGASISKAAFVIDLPDLGGAAKLKAEGVDVNSLISFDGH
ncbi:hypothetical protein D9M68_871000 [compost metagenome]